MTSIIILLKIILFIYLGSFTYITYQIFFYFQKRFLMIKTLFFFFVLAYLIIHISNKYNITFFIGFLFFYILGFYMAKHIFKEKIYKNVIIVDSFIYTPLKKLLIFTIKKAIFFSNIKILKKKIKLHIYYKKHPHKKPKSIYELF